MSDDGILQSIAAAEILSSGDGVETTNHDVDKECSKFPLTDLGNAQRFIKRFGSRFRYVPEVGWLAWDGRRWNSREADALVAQAVHQTILQIEDEATAIAGTDLDELSDG